METLKNRQDSRITKKGFFVILLSSFLLTSLGILFLAPTSAQRVKPYYNGEVVTYQDRAYVGTVDTGSFELFSWDQGSLSKQTNIMSLHPDNPEFKDLLFQQKDNRLYVYLTNGEYLYKYDISDSNIPIKELEIKDTAGDEFHSLTRTGQGRLATVGTKGVKIWNSDHQVINSFDIYNDMPGNLSFSPTDGFIFNLKGDKLYIFDTRTREYIREIELDIDRKWEIRKIVNDPELSLIYVVDDKSVKAFNFAGEMVREFEHISFVGYDVFPSSDGNHLYFSDGVGVVKLNKYDLEPVTWRFTDKVLENSWVNGLRAVRHRGEELVIGFNNSNILVMDSNLNILDHHRATEYDFSPIEPLFLRVDRNNVAPGSDISLRGGGMGVEEGVNIEFGGEEYRTYTDQNGRFSKVIEVPELDSGSYDIRVTGEISGLSYSLAFRVN